MAKNKNSRRRVQYVLRGDSSAEENAHKEMLGKWLGVDKDSISLIKPGRLPKRMPRRNQLGFFDFDLTDLLIIGCAVALLIVAALLLIGGAV